MDKNRSPGNHSYGRGGCSGGEYGDVDLNGGSSLTLAPWWPIQVENPNEKR